MNNLRLCLLVFFLLILAMQHGTFAQTDWQKSNFQGAVRFVRETEFFVHEQPNNPVSKISQISHYEYEFDRAGYLVQWADFYQNQLVSWYYRISYDSATFQKVQTYMMNEDFVTSKTVYQLDAAGNELYWYKADPSDLVLYHWHNTYDKKKRRIGAESYLGDLDTGKLDRYYVYKNDKKGNRISEHWYTADGTCVKIIRTSYDKKGQALRVTYFSGTGAFTGMWVRSYDEKGRLTEVMAYQTPTETLTRTTYAYDDLGNQTLYRMYTAGDSLISSREYRYTYDSLQNWTLRTQWDNGELVKSVEREISYFE